MEAQRYYDQLVRLRERAVTSMAQVERNMRHEAAAAVDAMRWRAEQAETSQNTLTRRLREVEAELAMKAASGMAESDRIQSIVAEYGARVAKLEWELSIARQQQQQQQQQQLVHHHTATNSRGGVGVAGGGGGGLPSELYLDDAWKTGFHHNHPSKPPLSASSGAAASSSGGGVRSALYDLPGAELVLPPLAPPVASPMAPLHHHQSILPPVTPVFQHQQSSTAPPLLAPGTTMGGDEAASPWGPPFGASAASQLELLMGTVPPPPEGYVGQPPSVRYEEAPLQGQETPQQSQNQHPGASYAASPAPFFQLPPAPGPPQGVGEENKKEAYQQLQNALSQAEAVGREYAGRMAAAAPPAALGQ